VFRDINVGKGEYFDVLIQNIGRKLEKIKLSIDSCDCARICTKCDIVVVSGIDCKVRIQFSPQKIQKYEGFFIIRSLEYVLKIPLLYYPPSSNIRSNLKRIEFGKLNVGEVSSSSLCLANFGEKAGSFKLKSEHKCVNFDRNEGILVPGESSFVKVSLIAQNTGRIVLPITITTDNNDTQSEIIELIADIENFSIDLMIDNSITQEIGFGTMFYGQKKTINGYLVNNSPKTQDFSFECVKNCSPFDVLPQEGAIASRGKKLISFVFASPSICVNQDYSYLYKSKVYFPGLKNEKSLLFSASTSHVSISISKCDFDFGKQKIMTKNIQILSISNESDIMNISFQIKTKAGFKFVPENGIIEKQTKKDIKIVFFPKNFGLFSHSSYISFGDGLFKKEISLSGESVNEISSQKFIRKYIWEEDGNEVIRKDMGSNLDHYLLRKKNDQEGTSIITRFAEKSREVNEYDNKLIKRTREIISKNIKNPNTIIVENNGLIPPEPVLPKKDSQFSNTNIYCGDISKPSCFKSKPTSNSEISDCNRVLDYSDLSLIKLSLDSIELGCFYVNNDKQIIFSLQNGLNHFVLLSLNSDCREMNMIPLTNQVIPPKQWCTFSLLFNLKKPRQLNNVLNVKINGYMYKSILIKGLSQSIKTHLSDQRVLFQYTLESTEQFIEKEIILYNDCSGRASFIWSQFDDHFEIDQKNGFIDGNSSCTFKIVFYPSSLSHIEKDVKLSIEGGDTHIVHLSCSIGSVDVSVDPMLFEIGMIPIGISQHYSLTLRNQSKAITYYSVNSSLNSIIKSRNSQGILKSNASSALFFDLFMDHQQIIEIPVMINIAGMEPKCVVFRGESAFPTVKMVGCPCNFGSVFIGGRYSKRLDLVNSSSIEALFLIDMSQYPSFQFEFSTDLVFVNANMKSNYVLNIFTPEPIYTNLYRIRILPKSSIGLDLVFSPKHITKCNAEIPMVIEKASEPNIISSFKFEAEAIHSPVTLSSTSINFGLTPIFNPRNPNFRPIHIQLTIKNESNSNIEFRLGNNSALSDTFFYDHTGGIILYADTFDVFFSFKPLDSNPYSFYLPLYIKINGIEHFVTNIHLTGIGSSKVYMLSVSSVALPIVPLGKISKQMVSLYNMCGLETTINYKTPIDENSFPLSVQFPSGNSFSPSSKTMPIVFEFKSTKSICFSTIIMFQDQFNNFVCLEIFAASDNSLFSFYPLFTSCESEKNDSSFGNIDILSEVIMYNGLLSIKNQVYDHSTEEFLSEYLGFFIFGRKFTNLICEMRDSNCELVLKMISILNRGLKSKDILSGVKQSENASINEKIEKIKSIMRFLVSQGAVFSPLLPSFLLSKNDYIDFFRSRIEERHLGIDYSHSNNGSKQHNQVLSEYTSTSYFRESVLSQLEVYISQYEQVSSISWTLVILQLIKIYIFNNSFSGKLSQIPGVLEISETIKLNCPDAKTKKYFSQINDVSQSNFLSQHEMTLLKWISIHYSGQNAPNITIFDNFNRIQEKNAILSVLLSHLRNDSIDGFLNEDSFIFDKDDSRNLMKIARIPFIPQITYLVSNSAIICALVFHLLFLWLPGFIPQISIDFSVELSQKLCKAIEISNQSSRPVKYCVHLSPKCPNFSIENNVIVISSQSSQELIAYYSSKRFQTENSFIILFPEIERYNKGETLIPLPSVITIKLSANVDIIKPYYSHRFDATCYEHVRKSLYLQNPYRGDYKIRFFVKEFKNSRSTSQINGIQSQFLENMIHMAFNNEEKITSNDSYDQYLKNHSSLIIHECHENKNDSKDMRIDLSIIPISIGIQTFFILCINGNGEEFIIEVSMNVLYPNAEIFDKEVKTKSNTEYLFHIPIDGINHRLVRSLAISNVLMCSPVPIASDIRLSELVSTKIREIMSLIMNQTISTNLCISLSNDNHYTCQDKYQIGVIQTEIPLAFHPNKPGDYPCRIVLESFYDTRVIQFVGKSTPIEKCFTIDIVATAGKPVIQLLPIKNPTTEIWNLKLNMNGSQLFGVPERISIPPGEQKSISIEFCSSKPGSFNSELVINNRNRESSLRYFLNAIVDEARAEDQIVIECKARELYTHSLTIPNFGHSSGYIISHTIPFVTMPSETHIGKEDQFFVLEMNCLIPYSGITAGKIEISSKDNDYFFWYVVEIKVQIPNPEAIISVSANSRQNSLVCLPISNKSSEIIEFQVKIQDKDLKGSDTLIIQPNSTSEYFLNFYPLKPQTRMSFISFLSEILGEFVYGLDITVCKAETMILSPMVSHIGQNSKCTVSVCNPIDVPVNFVQYNELPLCFKVMENDSFLIEANESKSIEILYYPSSVGIKETSLVSFKSNELGDFSYLVSGYGKPPLPESPIIFESKIGQSSSNSAIFINPFPYPSKFSVSMGHDFHGIFDFLSKPHIFSLTTQGEQYNVSLRFSPASDRLYESHLIVSSMDSNPIINWVYPLIGKVIEAQKEFNYEIIGRSREIIGKTMDFELSGLNNVFKPNQFSMNLSFPKGYEWLKSTIDIIPSEFHEKKCILTARCIFKSKRPVQQPVSLKVSTPDMQQWNFQILMNIDMTSSIPEIAFETFLNRPITQRVSVDEQFSEDTAFHAYFAIGSSVEFTLKPSHGFIAKSQLSSCQLPIDIIFHPRVYGRIMKGLLVVDTLESQFLFNVIGKTPEYIPPVFITDTNQTKTERVQCYSSRSKKRNIIQENIEMAKTPRNTRSVLKK